MFKHPYYWKFFSIGLISFLVGVTPVFFSATSVSGWAVLFGMLLAVIVSLILSHRALSKMFAPLDSIQKFVEGLREGRYSAKGKLSSGSFGELDRTLKALGKDLEARVGSLSHERAQFRAMLASMVEGVIAVDQEDKILFCNDAARLLLGESALGHTAQRLWEFVQLLPIKEIVETTRTQGSSIKGEISVRGVKEELMLEVQATPLSGDSDQGVVVVFHDITELRRLEGVRKEFVANVSHELKTPLTAIKGYVETLIGGALFDEKNNVRFLRKIEGKVDQLVEQVQDLLTLARIEANKDSLPLSAVDLNRIVSESVQDHELAIKGKGLELQRQLFPESVFVWGDEKAIRQVTHNLIDNAIKYTPAPGTIVLRVKKDSESAQIEVEDDGVGIPRQEHERIFERFYRVDKARSSEISGTGLGLSIVKHLVQSLHGTISVASQPDKGSRFTVNLPLSN